MSQQAQPSANTKSTAASSLVSYYRVAGKLASLDSAVLKAHFRKKSQQRKTKAKETAQSSKNRMQSDLLLAASNRFS